MKVEKKAQKVTAERIKKINEDAKATAKEATEAIKVNEKKQMKQAKKQVQHTSGEHVKKVTKEVNKWSQDQDKLLTTLREQAGITADEALAKIEKNAQKVSARSAQGSIDERMEEFHNDSAKVRQKSDKLRELGKNVTTEAQRISDQGIAEAEAIEHIAMQASKPLADQAVSVSAHGVRLAKKLHEYAAATKKLAIKASALANETDAVVVSAGIIEKQAKAVAAEASAQAKKNRAKLNDIVKETEEASEVAAMALKISQGAYRKTTPKGIKDLQNPTRDVKGLMKRCKHLPEGAFNLNCSGNTMYECANLDECQWCAKMVNSPIHSPCVPKPPEKCIWAASPTVPYTFPAKGCPFQTPAVEVKAFHAAEAEVARMKKEKAAKEAAHQKLLKRARGWHANKTGAAVAAPSAAAPAR